MLRLVWELPGSSLLKLYPAWRHTRCFCIHLKPVVLAAPAAGEEARPEAGQHRVRVPFPGNLVASKIGTGRRGWLQNREGFFWERAETLMIPRLQIPQASASLEKSQRQRFS